MLMKPAITSPSSAEQPTRGLRSRLAEPLIFLVAVFSVATWLGVSAAIIRGVPFWLTTQEHLVHLTVNAAAMTLVAGYATRVQGTLEYKLGQALLATFLAFGLYALLILGGRLFFSRPMTTSAVVGGAVISCLVVLARHQLFNARVAVIAPLISEARIDHLSLGTVIRDPNADLRGFDVVLVSLTQTISAEWSRALSRAMLGGCKVRHVGEYVEELKGAVSLEHFEVEHLPPNGIASYRRVKRLMDVGLVLCFLPAAVLIGLLGALGILITMGRPVFFVQERVGLGGEPFQMWKLRTMRPERSGEVLRAAVQGDTRVTTVGRILRRLRIDELPQLWNVLKGDMSLIGPRPEALSLHSEYLSKLPNYAYRYLVRPGITGWAQVCAPPSASAEEARHKLTYDLFYVKKLSIYLDLQIVARTFWTIASGLGVR